MTASGVVELLPGRLPRLCLRTGGRRRPVPAGTPCGFGVDVPGLAAGTRAGEPVTVVGTLRSGAIEVDRQAAQQQVHGPPRPAVPCAEPPGGWAPGGEPFDDRSPDDAAYGAFIARHQDLIGRVHLLKPAPDRQVAAVLARDEAERAMVERELGPSFPGRLCVVVAEHDVDAAPRAMDDLRARRLWGVMSAGTRTDEGLRRVVGVELVWVTDEAADFAQAHPDGVVELDPRVRVVDP